MTCRLIFLRIAQGLLFQFLIGIDQIDCFTNNFRTDLKAPVRWQQTQGLARLHPLEMKPNGKQSIGNKEINEMSDKYNQGEFYNDDAFGLIFLTSSLIIHDFFFCAIFLSATGITATLVNAGKIHFDRLTPGMVSVVSLALRIIVPLLSSHGVIADIEGLISSFVNSLGTIEYENYNPSSALLAETCLSTISLVWHSWVKENSNGEKPSS